MSKPHICSFSGSSSDRVSAFVRVSICLSDRMERNGHARRKKRVVELYSFVAHAQHNATITSNLDSTKRPEGAESLGKNQNSAHVTGLNVTENQQDREDSGRDQEPERRKVIRV